MLTRTVVWAVDDGSGLAGPWVSNTVRDPLPLMTARRILLACTALVLCAHCARGAATPSSTVRIAPWTPERAQAWYRSKPWLVGADYIPSTAVNQLEMWQASSFDPARIDQELSWAQGLGFTTLRVFLHSVAWSQDPDGFLRRMDTFLAIAQAHHIQPLFVFFDDCWRKDPHAGPQPAPLTGIHNSGWVQDPGDPASYDTSRFPALEAYVKAVLGRFKNDQRVLLWDLYNEPGNSGKGDKSLPLLEAVFGWAREVNPDQPITAGIWDTHFEALSRFQVLNSDVITYHNYDPVEGHQQEIAYLKLFGRPLICTEYMARPRNSRFSTVLPLLKREHVGALNWGFVAGKTNTIYAWDTPIPDGAQPAEWFHDILHSDGSPYRQDEVDLIRTLTGATAPAPLR